MSFYNDGVSADGYYWDRTRTETSNYQGVAFSIWATTPIDATFRRLAHWFSYSSASNYKISIQVSQNSNDRIYFAQNAVTLRAPVLAAGSLNHFFAFYSYSGPEVHKFWVNGVETTDTTTPGTGFFVPALTNRFAVGFRTDLVSQWKGDVSEAKVWSRDGGAMATPTDDQVRAIMAGGNPRLYEPDYFLLDAPFKEVDQPEIYADSTFGAMVTRNVPLAGSTHGRILTHDPIFVPSTAGGGGGPTVTPVPPRLQNSDRQFATITAHRLGGVLS